MNKVPLRLATLCVQGMPATSTRDNIDRLVMLPDIVRVLKEYPDRAPEAVVLPGGYFRLSRALGATDFGRRCEILEKESIAAPIMAALDQLDCVSPGLTLVTGALATPRDASERTEQLCIAWGRSGVRGVARKIFPTKQETRGRRYVSPYVDDYHDRGRVTALPLGSLVLLNACYDLFGTADVGGAGNSRRHAIRRLIQKRGKLSVDGEGFRALRDECLSKFGELVSNVQPNVLIATIHGFDAPGRDGYWQRHGVARASASLGGALVVAAAHFKTGLPTPLSSTLAASGVPRSHLTDGAHRLAYQLAPIHSVVLETPKGLRGLLRIYQRPAGASPRKGAKRP